LPGVVVPFLHTNLWEELGWTGFLQSTLQDRRGPLLASLIVVPFFALFPNPREPARESLASMQKFVPPTS
jgi:membrane protease YdiL (CAAX protease family)